MKRNRVCASTHNRHYNGRSPGKMPDDVPFESPELRPELWRVVFLKPSKGAKKGAQSSYQFELK